MEMNGFMGGIYKAAEWIMRLAIVNLLWLGFTFAGLIVGGLFPATQAAFAICRQWIRGETDIPLFKTFLSYFKKDYWKVQRLGWILALIGFVLVVDVMFIYNHTNPYVTMLAMPILLLCLLYILTAVYAFTLFVHYEMPIFRLLKHAVLHVLVRPFLSIGMLITSFAVSILMLRFPGVLPFFGVSVPVFLLMWFSHTGFVRNEEKQRSQAA